MGPVSDHPQKPFIIPVFIPHAGCPHRCAFCNQQSIAGQTRIPALSDIKAGIEKFLTFRKENRTQTQISFYGGNFLGLPFSLCRELLGLATRFVEDGKVNAIRFSTRPDTITSDRLEMLEDFPVATVELGAQSMDDQVLQAAHRGHSAADTATAVKHLKAAGLEIGLQMMIGLPGDNHHKALISGRRMADLKPDFVRIYPTLVLAKSLLGKWLKEGRYTPLELEEAVDLTARLYLLFKQNKISVVRMGLQASKALDRDADVLAGPYHPAFGHLVYARIFLDKVLNHPHMKNKTIDKTLHIKVHPRNVSRMRGLRDHNLKHLQAHYNLDQVTVSTDPSVALDRIVIQT